MPQYIPLPEALKSNAYIRRAYSVVSQSLYFPPLVVLVAILVITIWPWQNARQSRKSNFDQSIQEKIETVQSSLAERFSIYHTSLRSGAALLEADADTTKTQWDQFFAYKQRTTNRSGIQATGFTKTFTAAEYPQLQATMAAQGISGFTVHPDGLDPVLNTAVLYIYSPTPNSSSAIGYNMLSEPRRSAAMIRALESGDATLTRKLTLLQDVKTSDNHGFLLYVPVYEKGSNPDTPEARRANNIGFVYGAFRSNILFDQLLAQQSVQQGFGVSVYDGTRSSENLLYQTENFQTLEKAKNTYRIIRPVSMYGVTWQFEFIFNTKTILSRSENNAPLYILVVGIITAFLVFLALLLIFKNRARELQQQKDKEVNLAKDELLSLASHQMRTPATGVKQYLGMVLQGFAGKLSSSQQSLLDKAYTSNERQLQVINQILHLAKLESGRIVLAKHDAVMNELVKDVADEQHDDLTARGHKLKLSIPKKKITIFIDSHMIRMALENLLSNAIKYTVEPGTIRIKLQETRTHVRIAVKDSGIGIEAREFSTIFKQFTRLYDEKTERISGTGIGLYLAEQLVKLHKGTLTVHSTVGKGSEFVISLPKMKPKKQ